MALTMLAPALAFAETATPPDKSQNKFCEKLSDMESKIEQRIYPKEVHLKAKRGEQRMKHDSARTEQETKLGDKRAESDQNREEHFTKLEGKAKTDAEKQAIAVFEAAVKQAVTDRRAAIDSAIKTYRDGVDQSLAARKNSIDAAITAFKANISNAFEKAKAGCGNKADPKVIRAALEADLKAAKEKFHASRDGITRTGDAIQSLINARRQAFEKAKSDFQAAIESAKEALKTTLPQNQ